MRYWRLLICCRVSDWQSYKRGNPQRPILAERTSSCVHMFEEHRENAQQVYRSGEHHQHDPHEFLEWLLDTVHEELVSRTPVVWGTVRLCLTGECCVSQSACIEDRPWSFVAWAKLAFAVLSVP